MKLYILAAMLLLIYRLPIWLPSDRMWTFYSISIVHSDYWTTVVFRSY